MENFENLLNDLVTKLLLNGKVEFSQDGLDIKASNKNGCLSISASYSEPEEDNTEEIVDEFESYVKSLSDDFFIEVAESFEDGKLKEIQDKIDSDKYSVVKEGIDEFMAKVKKVASNKIKEINSDIKDAEQELTDLIEIRDSYTHVLSKTF